ncbi:MAG TPA: hypothetical protein VKO63_03885 [Chitinispirillaceae bacterium]|nr:hypothetical protein [Chitinispirillaceae bacterium]
MTFDILRQMIKPEALVAIAPSYSSFSVHLEEPQQPDSMVIIKGLPEILDGGSRSECEMDSDTRVASSARLITSSDSRRAISVLRFSIIWEFIIIPNNR